MSLTKISNDTGKPPIIQIGFEYEGVIKNNENKIVIYRDLPYSIKRNIEASFPRSKNNEYDNSPVDRYDCLAECKTEPISLCGCMHEDDRKLLLALFERIYSTQNMFIQNGLHVDWRENAINDDLHYLIISEIDKNISVERNNTKQVYTINEHNEVEPYQIRDNRIRGGGLHVNISGIEDKITASDIKSLYYQMRYYCDTMVSSYRNNLLFREKRINGIYVFEYMSFGFQLSKRYNFDSMFATVKHQFHWIDVLLSFLQTLKK